MKNSGFLKVKLSLDLVVLPVCLSKALFTL